MDSGDYELEGKRSRSRSIGSRLLLRTVDGSSDVYFSLNEAPSGRPF